MPERLKRPCLHDVYGVTLSTDTALAVPVPAGEPPADLRLEVTDAAPVGVPAVGMAPVLTDGRRRDGRPAFAWYRVDDGAVISITGAIDFHLRPDRIVAHVVDPRHAYLLEIALFGLVMSLWLEMRGRLTLHASTVVVDRSAVAFAGSRGSGKSSTAAVMVAAGHPLLADDLLAVDVTDGGAVAYPGYPQVRMWPEQAEHFTGHRDHPRFHPRHDKRRVVLGGGFGSFHGSPTPLRRIYLPHRADSRDAPIVITRLPPRRAMLVLLRQSFLTREMNAFGLQAGRLPGLAELLRTTRVCHITVPNGLDQLPRIADAIRRDLAGVS